MQQALRPYLSAGVALVGASMIAVTPMAAPLPGIQAVRDVTLTAVDLPDFSQILTDFQTSVPALLTSGAELGSAIIENPTGLFTNAHELFAATTFLAGDQKSFLYPTSEHTLDALHKIIFGVMTTANPITTDPALPESLIPIVNFLASPLSGVLLGAVSPLVAPVVPFINPFMEIIGDLQNGTTPDLSGIFHDLLTAPINSLYGLFSGSTLDLDPLAPLLASSGLLPAGFDITGLSYAFGGLFSPGSVGDGVGGVANGVGGSMVNALGLDVNLPPALAIPGVGIGPIGAIAGLHDIMALAIAGALPPLQPAPADAIADMFSSAGFDQWFGDLFNSAGLDQVFSDLASDFGI